jgi:uncharacterized protein YbaR (Trm112 family)
VPSSDFLAKLVCPVSGQPVIYFASDDVVVCPGSRLRYRIDAGVPVMLADEAHPLDDAELARWLARARDLGLPIPS